MIGFEVIAPNAVTFACRRKRQRTWSRGMVWASSEVAVAARWLATLPFADVQPWLAAWPPHPASESASATAATHQRTDRNRGM